MKEKLTTIIFKKFHPSKEGCTLEKIFEYCTDFFPKENINQLKSEYLPILEKVLNNITVFENGNYLINLY